MTSGHAGSQESKQKQTDNGIRYIITNIQTNIKTYKHDGIQINIKHIQIYRQTDIKKIGEKCIKTDNQTYRQTL